MALWPFQTQEQLNKRDDYEGSQEAASAPLAAS